MGLTMRKMLWIDTETYSETPLSDGTYAYAENCEVMLVSYALDDGPVKLWDLMAGESMPADLHKAMHDESYYIVAANSIFDRNVLKYTGLFPGANIEPERWIDTMVQAYCHGLPGALDKLCMVYKLSEDDAKHKDGRRLIHLFCKPNQGKRILPDDRPAQDWHAFRQYAMGDIHTMRILFKKMPKWNYPGTRYMHGELSDEHRHWCRDQRINDRGFLIDRELCNAAITTAANDKAMLHEATAEATDGEVERATMGDKLLQYMTQAYGVKLPDLRADTVKRRIEDENLPRELRDLLQLRIMSSKNSASKYKAAVKAVSSDGRLRGGLQFCGAPTTGRWSGRVFQAQNLMRPTMKASDIEVAVEDIKAGCAEFLYPNMAEVLGNCVRGVIVAPEGRKIIAADLSAIEGRGLAWLARDERVVQFYRDFDAGLLSYDSYLLAYSQAFGVDPSTMSKATHGAERQLGKPIELSLGYGGAVAAFLTFAMTYHLDISDIADAVYATANKTRLRACEDKYAWAKKHRYHAGLEQREYAACEYIKQVWRESRKPTVQFWEDLQMAWQMATMYEGETFTVGYVKFLRTGQWLRIRLPSGRNLNFLHPEVNDKGCSYFGLDRYTRKFSRQFTHGGKMAGWITQAFASDLLRSGLEDIENDGLDTILSIHDEALVEVDEDCPVDRVIGHLTRARDYAPGLPLVADGFETLRYRKDG